MKNKYQKHIAFTFIFVFLGLNIIFSQVNTVNTYKFLSLSSSARTSALGESLISVYDDDLSLVKNNPALLTKAMNLKFAVSHKSLIANISHENVEFGFHLKKFALPLYFGLQYLNYGNAPLADLYGDKSGEVNGSEIAIGLGTAYHLYENLELGYDMKFIFSNIGGFRSNGISMDFGALYHLNHKNTDVGFVLQNIGFQLKSYQGQNEKLPYNASIGISKRLEHMPFRINITATNLNRWNLIYDNPNAENNLLFFEDQPSQSKFSLFSDNFFRHFIFGGEFLLGKNDAPFRLRFSYNYKKAKEMYLTEYRSFAGFGLGFGLKLKKWSLDYAYNINHLIGGNSHFTFGMNLREFKKKT